MVQPTAPDPAAMAATSELVRGIGWFDCLDHADRDALLATTRVRSCAAGDVVIREGEYDCWIYFLLQGHLAIVKNGQTVRALRRRGDVFGEMCVVDGAPRSATIKAVDPSMVLGLDASIIDHRLNADDTRFCYAVYRLFAEVLTSRLRETTAENAHLRTTLSRFGNPRPR